MQLLIMHCIGHSPTGGLAACMLLRTGQGDAHVYEARSWATGDCSASCSMPVAGARIIADLVVIIARLAQRGRRYAVHVSSHLV